MDMKKFMKELKGKNKQSLRKEMKDLQDRQAYLRDENDSLKDEREQLRKEQIEIMSAEKKEKKDEIRLTIIESRLDTIRSDLRDNTSEYKSNSEALECYSKIFKNKDEGKSSILGTLFTGAGTGAAIWLGFKSLDKAYQSDVEGTLVNKKALDVFNRLNPLKLIHRK